MLQASNLIGYVHNVHMTHNFAPAAAKIKIIVDIVGNCFLTRPQYPQLKAAPWVDISTLPTRPAAPWYQYRPRARRPGARLPRARRANGKRGKRPAIVAAPAR
jgi:hypothetical protein